MKAYFRQLWEDLKYDVWRWCHIAPRLRFCRRRFCLKVVAAYPLVRPTLCRKHRVEHLRAVFERVREHFDRQAES